MFIKLSVLLIKYRVSCATATFAILVLKSILSLFSHKSLTVAVKSLLVDNKIKIY